VGSAVRLHFPDLRENQLIRPSKIKTIVSWAFVSVVVLAAGCSFEQADLKRVQKNLQQEISESNDETRVARARQSQELMVLREQELPQLHDQLERAQHQIQTLLGRQDDLVQRDAMVNERIRQLEQLAAQLDTDSLDRYAHLLESLNMQALQTKEDREVLSAAMNDRWNAMTALISSILLRLEKLEKAQTGSKQ